MKYSEKVFWLFWIFAVALIPFSFLIQWFFVLPPCLSIWAFVLMTYLQRFEK